MTKMQKRKNERIWEIDALRGHLILWILFFHLYVTVCKFCIDGIYGAIDPVLFAQRTDPLHFFYVIQDGTVSRGFFQKAYQLLQPQQSKERHSPPDCGLRSFPVYLLGIHLERRTICFYTVWRAAVLCILPFDLLIFAGKTQQ